jgi:hypothetical protein
MSDVTRLKLKAMLQYINVLHLSSFSTVSGCELLVLGEGVLLWSMGGGPPTEATGDQVFRNLNTLSYSPIGLRRTLISFIFLDVEADIHSDHGGTEAVLVVFLFFKSIFCS